MTSKRTAPQPQPPVSGRARSAIAPSVPHGRPSGRVGAVPRRPARAGSRRRRDRTRCRARRSTARIASRRPPSPRPSESRTVSKAFATARMRLPKGIAVPASPRGTPLPSTRSWRCATTSPTSSRPIAAIRRPARTTCVRTRRCSSGVSSRLAKRRSGRSALADVVQLAGERHELDLGRRRAELDREVARALGDGLASAPRRGSATRRSAARAGAGSRVAPSRSCRPGPAGAARARPPRSDHLGVAAAARLVERATAAA